MKTRKFTMMKYRKCANVTHLMTRTWGFKRINLCIFIMWFSLTRKGIYKSVWQFVFSSCSETVDQNTIIFYSERNTIISWVIILLFWVYNIIYFQGFRLKLLEPEMLERPLKMLLVGDGTVGKTSLCMFFTNKSFPTKHVPTM